MKTKKFIKQNSEPGDSHLNGEEGYVIGYLDSPEDLYEETGVKRSYACVYANNPEYCILTVDKKVNISEDITEVNIPFQAENMFNTYCTMIPFKTY